MTPGRRDCGGDFPDFRKNSPAMVTCILPTYNRRSFLPLAIEYFRRQDYAERELVIIDDGEDNVQDLIPEDPQIRYFRLDRRHSVGAKRNMACGRAAGDIIIHWDDDDWVADWRISYQASQLIENGAQICGLDRILYYQPSKNLAWEYRYPEKPARPWVGGNTLCYRKSFWQRHPFPDIDVGEDARFVECARHGEVVQLANCNFIVAMIHQTNVSRKVTTGSYWKPREPSEVRDLMGRGAVAPELPSEPPSPESIRRQALVAAARGIGDILRVTPLVAVLSRLGYAVDLLLKPDYPPVCVLLEGRPEIRQIFLETQHPPANYDLAVFTLWSAGQTDSVRAARKLVFPRSEWLRKGDTHCIAQIAAELGWRGELPSPFAAHSERRFDLPPGTVALHPGCKPDWPWKKWHGFDDLANLLPNVVIVGTEADLRNNDTYFPREFRWPEHSRNYAGKLSLTDTAALLSQCSAVVSNDSGMMHLGVALGVPTLGIFGITSPQREIMRAPNLTVVTKGLTCETACRARPFGQRDCEHHLKCLKTLTAEEVLDRLPKTVVRKTQAQKETVMSEIAIAYHGHVFDASGYGQAARAYIHALHAAGVEISVTDLSAHERQIKDPLVESLVGKPLREDFHLFHGIPAVWAQKAFRLHNAIAMTVWETDSMPTQWRNTLNHVLEVWLPCDFNTAVFQPKLAKPVFKLPHAVLPPRADPGYTEPRFRVRPTDFVFYSIFEWQDRKSPSCQLQAYLKAFPSDGEHILILKTNPGATKDAQAALVEARRTTGSQARVEICCEAWSEAEVELLQRRGDCYVSLHRGEGWGYPLFEAACAGKPVVATAYSGPLEYLSAEAHQLVSYKLTSVNQRFAFYHPGMRWAEPDLDDAVRRLQWVYENRQAARESARANASGIRQRHSLEAIGAAAKARLHELLRRASPVRSRKPFTTVRTAPPQPVPGDWYDADYFDNGIKSNWRNGYEWKTFQKLFEDTAAFLTSMFPRASSYLDAGCAKGFLVKALRDRKIDAWGFDCSPWAIGHAVPGTEAFLQVGVAESVAPGKHFDMTLAFDMLSQLTEPQALEFLTHARTWTSAGFFAVISLSQAPEGRDLSHVSLHSRDWWNQLFLKAGWRQDPLHAALESACQRHSLPAKMGWEIFLYAPGL